MSQENVASVREMYVVFARDGLEAAIGFWDPEITWRAIEGAPDDVGEMHGTDAARRYHEDWLGMFDDLANEVKELFDAGGDQVVAVVHTTGRAKMSGVRAELRYALVYTLRDGKILRVREYIDRDHALEAVGLRE